MWVRALASEVSFLVVIETLPGMTCSLLALRGGLGSVPLHSLPYLPGMVYIHWDQDIIIASGGVDKL